MKPSPIKQLARDYYKGTIARAEYVVRRRELLNSFLSKDQSAAVGQPAILGSKMPFSELDLPVDAVREPEAKRSRKNWGVTVIVVLLLVFLIGIFW